MKNQYNLVLILSMSYCITLICVGFLVRYYRNEIQRWVEYSCTLQNGWNNSTKVWDETIKEMIERENKILELINLMNILKNQLEAEKLENEYYKSYTNTLIEKIAELENKKLKPKPKK